MVVGDLSQQAGELLEALPLVIEPLEVHKIDFYVSCCLILFLCVGCVYLVLDLILLKVFLLNRALVSFDCDDFVTLRPAHAGD